ncbi:hypothetical protein Pla22_27200 [Rubripirellula amarantea]|uniref:Uncharacterized protein n=1 Tax=Rubripirellula amarantea TaxID=2527999 RepID=A0A5C5WWI7_9BACT|nr:hypothetical protein Pla22_27200 [Rubripirellula amarantea]
MEQVRYYDAVADPLHVTQWQPGRDMQAIAIADAPTAKVLIRFSDSKDSCSRCWKMCGNG